MRNFSKNESQKEQWLVVCKLKKDTNVQVYVYARSISRLRIFVKLIQNINENWKFTETATIVAENSLLFINTNKSHYPYFLIRCWLQLLITMNVLFTIRCMVMHDQPKYY